MRVFCKYFLATLAVFPVCANADPLPLTPGEYELTIATSIRGEAAKPDKYSRCIKEADLENVESIFNIRFFAGFKADPTCRAENVSLTGGKVAYAGECQKQTIKVDGRVAAKSFSVRRVAKAKAANGLGADSKIDGKWMGECKSAG